MNETDARKNLIRQFIIVDDYVWWRVLLPIKHEWLRKGRVIGKIVDTKLSVLVSQEVGGVGRWVYLATRDVLRAAAEENL